MRHLFAVLALPFALAAAELTVVPTLPVSRWHTEAGPDDPVALSADRDVLVIDFDVDITDRHQVGHQSLKQKTIRLLLNDPVVLPDDARRIVFEAWGHQVGTWNTQERTIQFRPLLRDAGGEWLSYTTRRSPHLKNAARARWPSAMSGMPARGCRSTTSGSPRTPPKVEPPW